MFGWQSKRQDTAEEEIKIPDLDQLCAQDLTIVFKHSPTCQISWAAQSQVKAFMAKHPEVPVQTILVRQHRELSRQIADTLSIRHESPQVIVLRHGVPVANASHHNITADFLTRAIALPVG